MDLDCFSLCAGSLLFSFQSVSEDGTSDLYSRDYYGDDSYQENADHCLWGEV